MWFVNNEGRRVEADVETNEIMRNIVRERGWQPIDQNSGMAMPKPHYLAPIQPGQDPIGLIMAAETGDIQALPPEHRSMDAAAVAGDGPPRDDNPIPDRNLLPVGSTPVEHLMVSFQALQQQVAAMSRQIATVLGAQQDARTAPEDAQPAPPQVTADTPPADASPDASPAETPPEKSEDAPEIEVPEGLAEDMPEEFRERFPLAQNRPDGWKRDMCQGVNKDGKQCGRALGKAARFCKQHQELFDNYVLIAQEG